MEMFVMYADEVIYISECEIESFGKVTLFRFGQGIKKIIFISI